MLTYVFLFFFVVSVVVGLKFLIVFFLVNSVFYAKDDEDDICIMHLYNKKSPAALLYSFCFCFLISCILFILV